MWELGGHDSNDTSASPLYFSPYTTLLNKVFQVRIKSKAFNSHFVCTLIKKKIKFSAYLRKFSRDRWQSHISLTASSYMVKYLHISSYIRKSFLIYDFATDPIWISLYKRKIYFYFFISVDDTNGILVTNCHHPPLLGTSELQKESRHLADQKRKSVQTPPPRPPSSTGLEDWVPWPQIGT